MDSYKGVGGQILPFDIGLRTGTVFFVTQT